MYWYRYRLFLILAAALCLTTLSLEAQSGGNDRSAEGRQVDELFGQTQPTKPAQGFGEQLPALERPVDPVSYRLGPNDQLLVSIPSLSPNAAFPVVVSVDNTVMLPRGILVNVRDLTLARFRRVVDSLYLLRSSSFKDVEVTLAKPRSIFIRVNGDVLNPGRYLATAADRVTTALDMANQVRSDLPTQQLESIGKQLGRESYDYRLPIRRVVLRHNDGTSEDVDLIRYQAFGNDADNPTLREGDEITVRRLDLTNATISIAQAVNNPTIVPYKEGDNALLLLRLASGIRPDADPQGAFIARYIDEGTQKIPINVYDTVALMQFKLMPGDRLFIPLAEIPPENRSGIVNVSGEVFNTGPYPIISGVTRLSEVMKHSGGVTPNAALNGAYIERIPYPATYKAKPQLTDDPVAGIATSSLTLDDTTRFKYDIALQQGRVAVDFKELVEKGNMEKDVILQNGDKIVIPRMMDIYVRGRVRLPGYVAYREGAPLDYYIERAGGYSEAAEPDRVAISKFGPSIWLSAEQTQIMPGDEIYVPGERDTPARTPLEVTSTIVSITAGVATIAHIIVLIVGELKRQQ